MLYVYFCLLANVLSIKCTIAMYYVKVQQQLPIFQACAAVVILFMHWHCTDKVRPSQQTKLELPPRK